MRLLPRTGLRGAVVAVALASGVIGIGVGSLFPDHVDDGFLARIPEPGMSLAEIAGNDVPLGLEIFSVYGAIRDRTDAGTVLLTATVPRAEFGVLTGLNPLLLRGIAGVTDIRSAPSLVADRPSTPPSASGDTFWGNGEWHLWLVDTEARVLVAAAGPAGELLVLDARLLPDRVAEELLTAASAAAPDGGPMRGLLLGTVADAVLLLLLLLSGAAVIPRVVTDPVRVPLGLLVGVGALAATGPLLLGGPLGPIVASLSLLGVAALQQHRGLETGWRREDLRTVVTATAGVVAVAGFGRLSGFVRVATDEVLYLAGASAMAGDLLVPAVVDPKRGVGIQALHSASFAVGAEGFHSLGAATLVATALLIGAGLTVLGVRPVPAALAAMMLLLSPSYRAFAALLNSHALVGALLLSVVVLIAVVQHRGRDVDVATAGSAVGVLLAGIVLLRPEGILLALLPLLAAAPLARRWRGWAGAWAAVGAALAAFHVQLIRGGLDRADDVPSLSLVALAVALVVITAPLALRLLPTVLVGHLGGAAVVVLWIVAALATVASAGSTTFWTAATENILRGRGSWGVLGPTVVLLILVVLARHLGRSVPASLRVGASTVLAFVPAAFVAKLLDGRSARVLDTPLRLVETIAGGSYGRIGWGDSSNRMWTHLIPTAIIVGVALIASSGAPEPARRAGRARAAAMLGAGLLVIAGSAWDPGHLLPERRSVVLSEHEGGIETTGELVAGVRVAQSVVIPSDRVDEALGLIEPRLCAALTYGTFGRRNDGTVEVLLDGPSRVIVGRLETSELIDNVPQEVCVPLDPADLPPRAEFAVVGLRGGAGASPAIWTAGPGSGGFSFEARPDGPVLAHGELAHRLLVRGGAMPPDRTLTHGIVRWAPPISAAALAVALLLSSGRQVRRRAPAGPPDRSGILPP